MALMITNTKFQALDSNGDPLSGGKVYTYIAGTSTPAATYPTETDADAGTNANANPVILDSRGEASIVAAGAVKIILKDSDDNTINTTDYINTASNDVIDGNGNELLTFTAVSSAVNNFNVSNSSAGNDVILSSEGDDSNIDIRLNPKGSGVIVLDSDVTVSSDATITGDAAVTGNTTLTGSLVADGLSYPTADGTAGQYMLTDGAGTLSFDSPITSVVLQTFTASGTYTPTTGMQYADIFVLGAGGGGGGGTGTTNAGAITGGGGAGGHAFRLVTAAQVGATAAVTIGSGGTAGSSSGGDGGTGGTSSVALIGTGTLTITAAGGGGGGYQNNGGATTVEAGASGGTTISGDDRSFDGGDGFYGLRCAGVDTAGNPGMTISGAGSDSLHGFGGRSRTGAGTTQTGDDGTGYGSGGSGGMADQTGSAAGGAGADGLVIIREYVGP